MAGYEGSPALAAGTTLLNAYLTREANREANSLTREMQIKNQKFTKFMWDLNNEYNSPANQRKRLEEAGINPYYALGELNTGNADLASNPSVPSFQQADYSALTSGMVGAADLMQKQRLIDAQASRTEEEAEAAGIDNQTRLLKNLTEINLMIQEYKEKKQNTSYLESLRDKILKLLPHEQEQLDSSTAKNRADAELATENAQLARLEQKIKEYDLNFIKPAELRQINSAIDVAASQVALNKANVNVAAQQATNLLMSSYGLHLDQEQQKKLFPFVRDEISSRIGLNRYNSSGGKFGPLDVKGSIPFAPSHHTSGWKQYEPSVYPWDYDLK